jgi:protein-S-isoprenylcysteine O-methyltransferase Ste14
MVDADAADHAARPARHKPSTAWLAIRMLAYFVSFLGFILGLLPFAAHQLTRIHGWPTVELGLFGQIVGGVLFLIFFVYYTVCSIWLSAVGRGAYVEFDPPTELVVTGPYRWVRNPVAAGVVAMIGAEVIFFSSTGILLLFVLVLCLAHLQVVLIEEPKLTKRFGESYRQYCQRVPRWIPRKPPAHDA